MGIESAVYETITVWGVKRGGTVFYTHCHKAISDGIADDLVDRLKVNLYKWIMQILFSHCKNHPDHLRGNWSPRQKLGMQQNMWRKIGRTTESSTECPQSTLPSLCLSHQSESRHTALQRGLCKLWCPKNVANIIIMWNENTLCPQILWFKKNGSENYYYQK